MVIFCFAILNMIKDKARMGSLSNNFILILEFYDFKMQNHHDMAPSSIFLKRLLCQCYSQALKIACLKNIETRLICICLK